MTKPRTFEESYEAIRAAGGDAWDNLDVEQELAAMRGQPQGIEALVCGDIAERQRIGIQKYGKTVANTPLSLREWLVHAYQECLDQAIYLRRAIDEIDQSNLPQLSDLVGLYEDSPIDVAAGWEDADEATDAKQPHPMSLPWTADDEAETKC